MKHKKLLVMALAAVMSVSALTVSAIAKTPTDSTQETTAQASRCQSRHGRHGAKEEIQAPENAIGKDAAKEAALKDANLTEADTEKVRAHLSALEDGTVIYKVHFTANDKWYSYQIDALTGKVLDKSEEDAQEHAAAKQHGKHGKAQEVAEPENAVGKDAAKAAALKDAKLTEADTEKVRAHLSALEDGTVIYKVHFTAKDKWYSYQIDALTGKVLDKSEEDAQEHAEAKQHGKRKTEAADAAGSETSSGKQRSKGSRTADAVTGASEGMSVAAGTV